MVAPFMIIIGFTRELRYAMHHKIACLIVCDRSWLCITVYIIDKTASVSIAHPRNCYHQFGGNAKYSNQTVLQQEALKNKLMSYHFKTCVVLLKLLIALQAMILRKGHVKKDSSLWKIRIATNLYLIIKYK